MVVLWEGSYSVHPNNGLGRFFLMTLFFCSKSQFNEPDLLVLLNLKNVKCRARFLKRKTDPVD